MTQKGFSLLEAVISLWILGIVIMSVVVFNATIFSKGDQRKIQALNLMRNEMESCIMAVKFGKSFYRQGQASLSVSNYRDNFINSRPNAANGWTYRYKKEVLIADSEYVKLSQSQPLERNLDAGAMPVSESAKGIKPYQMNVVVRCKDAKDLSGSFTDLAWPSSVAQTKFLLYQIDVSVSWNDNVKGKRNESHLRELRDSTCVFSNLIFPDLF